MGINGSNNSYIASNLQHKQMLCEDTLCFVIFFLFSQFEYVKIVGNRVTPSCDVFVLQPRQGHVTGSRDGFFSSVPCQ